MQERVILYSDCIFDDAAVLLVAFAAAISIMLETCEVDCRKSVAGGASGLVPQSSTITVRGTLTRHDDGKAQLTWTEE
jgi:hypothetical protein